MDNVVAIARSTYVKHARSKALYLLWIILIILIATASRYDILSIGRARILMTDLGLALVALVGAASVMVLGYEVPRELRQRIAENLLSKPVGRDQYLAGKFLGTLMFAIGNVLFVTVGYAIAVLVTKNPLSGDLVVPLLGIFGMVLILAAASAVFGTVLSEVPAVIATFLVFWLGHSTEALAKLGAGMDNVGRMVLKVVYGLLPNLGLLNTRGDFSQTMYQSAPPITWGYVGVSLAYSVLYAGVLFVLAMWLFRRRDL